MTVSFRRRLPIAAGVALLTMTATSAFAQTPPTPQDVNRQGVREILGRAEAEGARRTLGEILGGIAGVSQAQAQTGPPPAAPGAAGPASPPSPISVAQTTPPPGATQAPPTRQGTPAAAGVPQAPGTPAQPTMIVRVPGPNAPGANAPAAAVPDLARTPAEPATVASAPVQRAAPDASGPAATGLVVATAGPRVIGPRRPFGYVSARAWCPPGR